VLRRDLTDGVADGTTYLQHAGFLGWMGWASAVCRRGTRDPNHDQLPSPCPPQLFYFMTDRRGVMTTPPARIVDDSVG